MDFIVKPSFEAEAKEAFKETEIQIMVDGCHHLGAALGTDDYCRQYVSSKVENWCHEVRQLAQFAHTQPQAAYAAFVHGLRHKWSFFARTRLYPTPLASFSLWRKLSFVTPSRAVNHLETVFWLCRAEMGAWVSPTPPPSAHSMSHRLTIC